MPSKSDAHAFDREINRLIREAATAEQADVARLLRELAAVQRDVRTVLIDGDSVAAMIARLERRLETLERTITTLFTDSVPAAVTRGVAFVDLGLAAAGVDVAVPIAVDVSTGPTMTLRAVATQQVADLQRKVVYQLTRLTGPSPAQLDELLKAIGARLRGSVVFGGPAARAAGAFSAILGDVTGAATGERARLVDEHGGHRTLKRWVHGASREPRPEHLTAASRYAAGIPWGQQFEIGSYRTPRPRGPGLPGPQRFGCRCQVAPVLATEE